MYPNISYALLSAALIVLSMVHLILLTVHRPQPHRLPEISIFVLFICVNAVVIGIGLSGLRRGDDSAEQNPERTTYERPAASIISRIWFSIPRGKVRFDLMMDSSTTDPSELKFHFCSLLVFILAGKLVVRLDASTSQNRRTLEYAVTLGTAASKVILVLRGGTSTLAMRENAEPNKRTDRSQDRDDDQTTAHVPQTEIGRKRRTEVRQRLRLYCCTSLNQTSAVPATHLSQAIEIDEDPETETDSVLEMLPYSELKQKWREQQQKRQTWVNRAIKCCDCEVTGSAVNKCASEHEYCGILSCGDGKDNPTTGDGKPPFQSTPNNEARDLQSHSSSYNPYSIDEANCYSDYSDIRGDICRGDENAPLAFIVFISEPVLQERLEYLKAHTSELHKQRSVFRTFSELRVDGPLALPYALCLVKTLRQHAGQQLLMNRLNDTILFLSTRLRGLLSTHLLYTHRDCISHASLLLQRPVFYKCSDLPGNIWQESTVLNFSLDGLTVTLHLSNYRVLKVSDELWKRFNSLASGIADPAGCLALANVFYDFLGRIHTLNDDFSRRDPYNASLLAGEHEESRGTVMAATVHVYRIHDPEPSVIPRTGLSPQYAYGAHVFRWKEYLFITSNKKPNVSGVQDISLKGLSDEQGFLHAAAASRKAPQVVEQAYLEIINNEELAGEFTAVCDRCDAVMIEYLEIVKTEWLKFAEAFESGLQCLLQTTKEAEVEKALKQLKNCLHILRDSMGNVTHEQQTENIQHPKSWALDSLLCLLGDCLGRMEMIKWAFDMAKPSKGPYDLLRLRGDLMYIKGRYKQGIGELDENLARLTANDDAATSTLTGRPTVHQSLLHLCIVLLESQPSITAHRLRRQLDIMNWQPTNWEKTCNESDDLSDDNYLDIALTLEDLEAFEGIKLTGEMVKEQYTALMRELRRLAGDIAPGVPKSDDFSLAANVILICTFSYREKRISSEGAADELDRIILPLRPNRDPAPSPEIKDSDVSRLPLPERRLGKRLSDGDLNQQKRSKMSEASDFW
ncbi:predicted protein [Histoplasma mississippiense (nom. inval.)]|uniref:predicted protein n=1 Tax=Ajellomyces capsulatus (strain NAm1 / WU24) TaxID=2059318 RepID=UPI000157CF91|nr:predicted protein [Histoplasma mississippiense (nom. inval.)]EDN11399.1 predicted protein [Histoplasma mississippiense (nom. inval.)]